MTDGLGFAHAFEKEPFRPPNLEPMQAIDKQFIMVGLSPKKVPKRDIKFRSFGIIILRFFIQFARLADKELQRFAMNFLGDPYPWRAAP